MREPYGTYGWQSYPAGRLLQNALVHIDLLKTAAIRLMVFNDRVEIVNPGCVMGGHTIDEVKLGNSYARNPLMANFCAKTMPYRGLGSGIPRVLAEDSHVEFIDSKEGNQFTVRVNRPLAALEAGSNTDLAVSSGKEAVSSGKKAVSSDEKAVSKQKVAVSKEQMLLAFCVEPKSLSETCKHLGLKDKYKVKKRYIDPLLNKSLRMTVNPRLDKYVMNDREKEIVRKALGDKPKERLANAGWMLKAVDAIRNIAVGTKSEVYQIGAESAVRFLVDTGLNLAEGIVENLAEIVATTASLFFGYVDAATTISQSCGGGGCNNELPHRKDKKDNLAFARRCHQAAKTMIQGSHKRGLHL